MEEGVQVTKVTLARAPPKPNRIIIERTEYGIRNQGGTGSRYSLYYSISRVIRIRKLNVTR